MNAAYKQAILAYKEDEVPVGCVIVKDGKIIARAHNKKEKKNCAVFHAEIECILKATKKLNNWYLEGCDMYVTLEPCMMCTGAIVQTRIENVYYACKEPKGGSLESNIKLLDVKNINHYPSIHSGEMEEECRSLLQQFFKNKRNIAKAIKEEKKKSS